MKCPKVGRTAQAEEEEEAAAAAAEGDGGAALPHGAANHGARTGVGTRVNVVVSLAIVAGCLCF